MFMDAPNKTSRDRYGNNNLSKFMLNLRTGSCIIGAVFLLSACVAEKSSLELSSPLANSQPNNSGAQPISADGQNASLANAGYVSPYPDGSPIPTKAPRSVTQAQTASSLVSADGSTQQIQAYQNANTENGSQVVSPLAGQTSTLVTSLAVPTRNPNKPASQVAIAAAQANSAGIIEPTTLDQAQTQTTQIAALDPNLSQEAPKGNFFTRWANSVNQNKQATKKSTHKSSYLRRGNGDDEGANYNRLHIKKKNKQVQVASLSPNATSVSTNAALSQTDSQNKSRRNSQALNALPGVKTNNEIFGIEEHEDEAVTQVAAAGGLARLSPNGLRIQHSKVQVSCLKQGVLQILKKVERRYGKKPIITSGFRSAKRNRRAGGARNSQHIYCKAVDIQVEGVSKWNLAKYLRSIPGRGGVGTYCRTKSVHVDIGSKRDWHSKCRRSSVKKRKKKKNT